MLLWDTCLSSFICECLTRLKKKKGRWGIFLTLNCFDMPFWLVNIDHGIQVRAMEMCNVKLVPVSGHSGTPAFGLCYGCWSLLNLHLEDIQCFNHCVSKRTCLCTYCWNACFRRKAAARCRILLCPTARPGAGALFFNQRVNEVDHIWYLELHLCF